MTEVLKLYPPPLESRPLRGLFLDHDLSTIESPGRPFVYSNFITSLDGRIAVPDENGRMDIPEAIANDRDWRLFQELAAQSDLAITSGRYLREYEAGDAQEILQFYDDPQYEDLRRWRESRGMQAYPDLAVVSASSDFPIPEVLRSGNRQIHVFTTETALADRLPPPAEHVQVFMAGKDSVDAGVMVRELYDRGYRRIYNAAGPQVLHLLIASGSLDRLYLTQTGRMLGGEQFATIIKGGRFAPPLDFRLSHLYYDPAGIEGLGQLFQVFDRAAPV